MNSILFLNSFGTGELMAIMAIVLILFGANSIPKIARTLGRGVRQMKDATQDIQRDIHKSTKQTSEDLNVKKQIEETLKNREASKKDENQQGKA